MSFLAEYFAEQITQSGRFALMKPPFLGFTLFRVKADDDAASEQLLATVNASGKIYLSHTKVNGRYAIRNDYFFYKNCAIMDF